MMLLMRYFINQANSLQTQKRSKTSHQQLSKHTIKSFRINGAFLISISAWNTDQFIFYLMEERTPILAKKLSDPHNPSAHQANHPPKEITSLPNMPSLKELQLSRMNSIQKIFALPEQACTLSIHELVYRDRFSEENIYAKVYAFIKEIMNNHAQHFDILRKFQQIEAEIKFNFKKSIKVFPFKRTVIQSKEKSLGELDNNIPVVAQQGKKKKKVCFREENQEGISIKLINSRKSDFNKSKRSLKSNISLSKLDNIEDKVVLEEIESVEDLDCYKPNGLVEGSHSKLSNEDGSSSQSHEGSKRPSFKKISIVMFDENEQREEVDSELFSSESHISLKDLDLPKLKLSESLIEQIFDSPSPFLINLSLCLLFKFFMKSKFQPQVGQIGWLLGVATMVAYKIFVDETIEGLAEYYCKVLKIKSDDLLFLQRWFLAGLNYEVVISNLHYTQMLMRISKDSKQ